MGMISIRYAGVEGDSCIYEYTYPYDRELLEVFPEAESLVPHKINDWLRQKGKILAKETIPYFKKCNALKDEFSRAFWKECYRYLAGRFNEIERNLTRLKRLEVIINAPERSHIFADLIQAAKKTPLESIYNFQRLRRVGRAYTACCPIHNDKTPSFHIYPGNSWYCFGCNRGGDTIDFVMRLYGMKFPEATAYLAGGSK